MQEKNKINANKKEVDDALKKLDEEIRMESKKNLSNDDLNANPDKTNDTKCNYYNLGYC